MHQFQTLLLSWLLMLGYCTGLATVDWTTITDGHGNHLPDFSFAGYHSSDISLPSSVKPLITLDAASGDQTARIQAALNKVSAAGGGAVKLGKGTFSISSGLNLTSNVVLSGSGVSSTKFSLKKIPNGAVFTMGNGTGHRVKPTLSSSITNTFVGIGSSVVTVSDAKGFRAGQAVFVNRAVTAKWVRDNGMADLVRNGKPQTWIGVGTLIQQPRIIKSISGNNVTFTVPLTDTLDRKYMSPYLSLYTPPPTSAEIGLEDFSVTLSPSCSGVEQSTSNPCSNPAISINYWTVDSYIQRVNLTGFNKFVAVQSNASRITMSELGFYRDRDTDNSAGYPADISIAGSQVLVQDSGQYGRASAAGFGVVTQGETPGPNAMVRHVVQGAKQQLYPHQRWAHGFLADNTGAPVDFVNRGNAGSGHGWTINGGVAWNVRGAVNISSPPLGVNWGIGITGPITDSNGTFESRGAAVSPASLFEAQLARRKKQVN